MFGLAIRRRSSGETAYRGRLVSSDRPQVDRALPHTPPPLLALAIFAVWLVVLAYGALHHVIWRDEMRALSLTLEAPNLLRVPQTIQGEGHPALWYIVLRIAYDIFRTNLVLPGVSIVLSIVGAALIFWKSPFPLWWKTLFIFSGLAIFEYSIFARDYALIMPLFFGLAIAITAKKRRYGLISLLLFLTMQVDIYATLLAPLFVLVLLKDWRKTDRAGRIGILVCGLGVALGFVAAVIAVYPPKHDLVTRSLSGQLSLLGAAQHAITSPGVEYIPLLFGHGHLMSLPFILDPEHLEEPTLLLTTLLLYGSCLGLASDLILFTCALAGLWVTTSFSLLIYPMYYRHAGVWIVFLTCLYWIKNSAAPPASAAGKRSWIGNISWMIFTSILVIGLDFGIPNIIAYRAIPSSNSRALANILKADPALRSAIIIPDPGEMAESLPYYASNPIYMPRERKFGQLANWTNGSTLDLSLGDMMVTARALQKASGKPIVFIIKHALEPGDHLVCVGFDRSFRYTRGDYETFVRSTRVLPLGPALDETYNAYLLPVPSLDTAPQARGSGQADSEKKQADHDIWTEGDRGAARLQCGTHTRADIG